MNRDIELIDRRIVTHEAIIEALRALRSDFEAERRTAAETPVTAPACPPAATLEIQAGTDRLCAEDARPKTTAPAAQQSPRPAAQQRFDPGSNHRAPFESRHVGHRVGPCDGLFSGVHL